MSLDLVIYRNINAIAAKIREAEAIELIMEDTQFVIGSDDDSDFIIRKSRNERDTFILSGKNYLMYSSQYGEEWVQFVKDRGIVENHLLSDVQSSMFSRDLFATYGKKVVAGYSGINFFKSKDPRVLQQRLEILREAVRKEIIGP